MTLIPFRSRDDDRSPVPDDATTRALRAEYAAPDDRYWDGLLAGGGTPEQCGWLRDRFGVCWQIVPKQLGELMSDPDRARAERATDAMLKMVKLDIATLQAAAAGKA